VPAAIAMFDREMNYLFTSRQWLMEVQLPDETSHIGKNLYSTIPNQPKHWIEAHERGMNGERLAFDLEEVRLSNGDSVWYQWGVSPWSDAQGNIGGILIYIQNVTQRVIADRLASKINEERMRRQIRVEAGEMEGLPRPLIFVQSALVADACQGGAHLLMDRVRQGRSLRRPLLGKRVYERGNRIVGEVKEVE
jgi:hypothetical protein